jgi:predicted TIM-barrel fold metal-dependent hydrolase
MAVIDCDQHLYESRTLWREHIDPVLRAEALRIEDDAAGVPRLLWRDEVLGLAEVQVPGRTLEVGERHRLARAGVPPPVPYDVELPRDYWDPAARRVKLAEMGVDEGIVFPNYGLLWERVLHRSLPALTANMAAWNRWCATVVEDGGGVVHPVAHLTLRDATWLEAQLAALARAGVRLAMIAPALVDGRPLSHPAHERLWAAFCAHGITPVFHVAEQPRVFADAWYTDEPEAFVPALSAVFLYVPAALACADLIFNGVLERFPDLRIGIVELSALWVPLYLMMLDGGWEFTSRISGRDPARLPLRPSEYFRRQVRVSAFAYETPAALRQQIGDDLFMCCSDYPHSEGTATPVADYDLGGALGLRPAEAPRFFHDNAAFLLRKD